MRIISKRVIKTSDMVGEVTFDIIRVKSEFFGATKMIKMCYTKNGRKVTRSFDTDECGRIKFTNACEKLSISSDYILVEV